MCPENFKWVKRSQSCIESDGEDIYFGCPIYPGKWTMSESGFKCVRTIVRPTCPANFVWNDDSQYCYEKKGPGIQTMELITRCPLGPGKWSFKRLGSGCVQSSVEIDTPADNP